MKSITNISIRAALGLIIVLTLISCPNPVGNDTTNGDDGTTTDDPVVFTVLSVTPENGATDIDLGAWPSITFSEELAAGTISNQTIMVLSGSEQVDVTLHFADTNPKTVDIEPNVSWDRDTEYTIRVSTAIEDAAGNGMDREYTSTFRTVVAPPDSNDYGYDGSNAGTLTGTFDFSNMTEEAYDRVDIIRFGFGQGLDNLHVFEFYKDNFEETGRVHSFEILNVQPLDFTEGYLAVPEPGDTSDLYLIAKSEFPGYDTIPDSFDFDLTDSDFSLEPIFLYDTNDGWYTGVGAVTLSGSFDLSAVSGIDDYDSLHMVLYNGFAASGNTVVAEQRLPLDRYSEADTIPFEFYNVDPAMVDGTSGAYDFYVYVQNYDYSLNDFIFLINIYAPTTTTDFGVISLNTADPVINTPSSGSSITGTGINDPVTLVFSEKMRNSGSIKIGNEPAQDFFELSYNTTPDSPTNTPGDWVDYYYESVDIVPVTSWEYDTTYTVHTPVFMDFSQNNVDTDNYSFTFTTVSCPLQTLTGSSLSSGTYQDSTDSITYVFDTDGTCTRTAGGQNYSGNWEYSGDDFRITTRYETDADNYTDIAETYNAGYTLDGGANLYPYGYVRTTGSGDTIVGSWEFAYRIETTQTVGGEAQTTTYTDVTTTMTFEEDGTWESSMVTKTDANPTGTTETDSGTWDVQDFTDGVYQLVGFEGREFLHLADMPAYTQQ